jgi:ubiquitin C-terminal hydrolase
MNIEKYRDKGVVGLANLGNTCFLNSCLQVLIHTYELHDLVDRAKYNREESNLLNEWVELRNLMWSGRMGGVVSPNKFVHHVQTTARDKNRDIFTGWVQNDISEFLFFLMDCFHTILARKTQVKISGNAENDRDVLAIECFRLLESIYQKEYSEIMDLFYGIYMTTIISSTGETVHSVRPEHYFILDLQVFFNGRMFSNIYECFDLFTDRELMSGENAWFNDKTGEKEDILKGVSFWSFPKILVITLKRFSGNGSKIENHIDFPLENLDLTKYVKGYNPESYIYDLFGVCNHMGGAMGGHYTSCVKNMVGQWFYYNDGQVSTIENKYGVVSPNAYCLFYRKK